ncbi:MAG: hypothetical protein WDM76_02470 [Limisphaerales bacterium]
MGGTEIDIEVDDKNICTIRCGSSFFKIHGLGADEFPTIAEVQGRQEKLRFNRKP